MKATQYIQSRGENVEIKSSPYFEKKPHPEGQKAFLIEARLPWHREFHTKVYAEFSFRELIIMNPQEKNIIHEYGENLGGSIYVYPVEEIIAEKIRALLQFAKKLHERGWGRSRVRDYYDIWRILGAYSDTLRLDIIPALVKQKCLHKNIPFVGINGLFQEKLTLNLEKEWEPWLLDIVSDLPQKDIVISDLRRILGKVFNEEMS